MATLAAVMEVQEKLTEVAAMLAGMSGDTNKLMETVASYRDIAACIGSSNPPCQPFSSSRPASLALWNVEGIVWQQHQGQGVTWGIECQRPGLRHKRV